MVSLTPQQKADLMKSPAMKELKRKYDAKLKGSGRKRAMKGMGWWDTIGRALDANVKNYLNNVNKTVKAGAKKAQEIDKYLRDSKIISKVSDVIAKGAEGVEGVAGFVTAVQPELAEITVPILAGAEATKDVAKGVNDGAKSIGYGKKRINMKGLGKSTSVKPYTAKPKGVITKRPTIIPRPTITHNGMIATSSVPTNVSSINKKMSGRGMNIIQQKGRGVPVGTFGSISGNYGKTVGL